MTTIAGNNTFDSNGDGLLATRANLSALQSIAVDNAGSLIFDEYFGAIGNINLNTGILTTAAGDGTSGSTGDGRPSTGPILRPRGVAFDAKGNLYFAEPPSVRTVVNGVYATLVNVAGNVGSAGDGGQAAAAQLDIPASLAFAANGDLYIGDVGAHRVRVVRAQTGIIGTLVGNGTGSSTGDGSYTFADGVLATSTGVNPISVFADESSNLFIADQTIDRIRKVNGTTNIITTVAGNGSDDFSGDGGPALNAPLTPIAIAIDRAENLYIADGYRGNARIRATTVNACFFNFSAPIAYIGKQGGAGAITFTATHPDCPYNVMSNSPFVTITSGGTGVGGGTVNFTVNAGGAANRTGSVNIGGSAFAIAQAGALGQYNVGFFQPNGPTWALDSNGSGMYEASDRVFAFAGQPGAIAVVGDWNGDGRTKVGYYLNGFWALDYNGNGIWDGTGARGDKFYAFGGAGFTLVVADWNGDGRTKVGYYNQGFWALDLNGNGQFDGTAPGQDGFYGFGGNGASELPIVGDWNGDGRAKVGFFYQGKWALDYDGNGLFTAADKYYTAYPYSPGDRPVVGDWTGDGKSKIGIFRNGFWILDTNNNGTYDGVASGQDKFYGFGGNSGEVPIVADWNGSGTSKIGEYLNGFWILDFNGNGSYDGVRPSGDRFVAFGGAAGNQPLIGRW